MRTRSQDKKGVDLRSCSCSNIIVIIIKMSTREHNVGVMSHFISNSAGNDLKTIPLNKELFGMMAYPACFKQCARTDVDILF